MHRNNRKNKQLRINIKRFSETDMKQTCFNETKNKAQLNARKWKCEKVMKGWVVGFLQQMLNSFWCARKKKRSDAVDYCYLSLIFVDLE